MENLSAFIMELTKLHNASKSERDEARDKHKALEKSCQECRHSSS